VKDKKLLKGDGGRGGAIGMSERKVKYETKLQPSETAVGKKSSED